ncbi:MAG TPA: mannose-1-phosphate guanylyltransferase [Thermoanaerobaculia bacterium]|nr:mannose-1-phosphate guanylyltransferase [Thermoanaerobaculia bacterium]
MAGLRVLLLAGGGGTRLWPLSSEERPKQFLPLVSQQSLLAETFERLVPLTDEIFVATSEKHADLVLSELKRLPADRVIPEPVRRNSGPALLSAALQFERDGDPVTAAIPADQTVADDEAFRRALVAAAKAADSASAVVMAVAPSRPETEYGYLEMSGGDDAKEVARFIEKPSPAEAEECVRSGCFWNAGIFIFRPSRFLAEARRVAADLVAAVERYRERLRERDDEGARAAYAAMPSVSIDYAVMERIAGVRAVPLRAGWSDVGTWRSVRDLRGPSDDRGNLILSDVPVLAPGVRDSAIIVARAGVLVLPFEREAELRAAVERLGHREEPAAKKGS